MRRSLLSVVLLIGCYGSKATAQVTINAATLTCQQTAMKAVAKFEGKVAAAIEKCLLEVTKCNMQVGVANAACVGRLLIPNVGACAVGKLGPNSDYFGFGSSLAVDSSVIGKANGAFTKGLAKCAPLLGVDYSALEFPNTSPSTVNDVAESLNAVPGGAACLAHKRVLRTFPARDTLFEQLANHPDGANVPSGVFAFYDPANPCK